MLLLCALMDLCRICRGRRREEDGLMHRIGLYRIERIGNGKCVCEERELESESQTE